VRAFGPPTIWKILESIAGVARKLTHHDSDILIVNAVIVDRRLQEVRVFLEPGGESVICFSIWEASYYHFGRFSGVESILICCCLRKLAVDMVGS